MPSGIIQLLASGAQDKILIGNPQFNHFKQVYMKYSNFSIFNYEVLVPSQYDFGSLVQFEIPKNGDLLRGIQVKIELPQLSIKYNNSANVEIQNIKNQYSYKSIDLTKYDYNLYNLNMLGDIMNYQMGNSSKITNFELFLYNSNTNTETYSVVIPKIDLNQYINTGTSEYYFEINPNPLIFSNTSVNFNFPLIKTPIIDTDYTIFYNKLLLYTNRNNKFAATYNVIQNLFSLNDNTTLLTSDNIKNILLKEIKQKLFNNEEFASIDSLIKYINSIRFIRPITLFDSNIVNNFINGGDNDLIGLPEYNETYYNTNNLQQVVIEASISNLLLNSLDTRLLYVLTTDLSVNPNNIITLYDSSNNRVQYSLYNILKIEPINTTKLDSLYNQLIITSYVFVNYLDILLNPLNINNIKIKITPISNIISSTTFELNNFSELFSINNIELLLNNDYKITVNTFKFDVNLINRYIYFYYQPTTNTTTTNIQTPFCIFQISNYYILDNQLYLFGKPINFVQSTSSISSTSSTVQTFDINLLYLIDNKYVLQANTNNSNEYDIKKVTQATVNSDSINLYNDYISNSLNVNFNLDNTLSTETTQKQLFVSNFTSYIIQNIKDNYAIIYNIISTIFQQPSNFVTKYSYATNLYFQVSLTDNGVGGLSLINIGTSTFTKQDNNGNSIMIKFLNALLNTNFDGLLIANNNYLTNISNAITSYGAVYQDNWNILNNTIQRSSYMLSVNQTINYLENTEQYISVTISNDLNSFIGQVNVMNGSNLITSLQLTSSNYHTISDVNYLYLYLNQFNSDIFLIKPKYTLTYTNTTIYTANIINVSYANKIYAQDLPIFMNSGALLNDGVSIHGNYILEDFIYGLYNSINTNAEKYINNKYSNILDNITNNSDINVLSLLDTNLLYKDITIEFHNLINIINVRINSLVTNIPSNVNQYIIFMSDFEYLTDGIKLTNYFYNNIVINFFDKSMINGYYYINSFATETNYSNIYTSNVSNSTNCSSFSKFINNIIDTDPVAPFLYTQLLKTYLYYNYGNQLNYSNNNNQLNVSSIRDTSFSNSSVHTLNTNLINLSGSSGSSSVYDLSNVIGYLNNVTSSQFQSQTYQYNINPHLYYSYLNLGYIENLLSLNTYGNINLEIKNYTNFKYSDIDNVITSVLGFYSGTSNISINGIGNVVLTPGTQFYSNITAYSSVTQNVLTYNNNTTNTILNDLVTYSIYRVPTSGVSQNLINNCNIFAQDVKNLIMYFNDYLDNLQVLRFIQLNDTTITSLELYNNLQITNYSSLSSNNINDYIIQYYSSITMYNSINTFRSSYIYNDLITAFDTDSQNYYNYLISINNTITIGSSLKKISDITGILYPQADIYNLVNTQDLYGQIAISNLANINTYLVDSKNIFTNYYTEYINNRSILNLQDNIELNTINNTIKSLNLNSGLYTPTLSSMDQFTVYERQLFGYNIDTNQDYIFNSTCSYTHAFSNISTLSNIQYYNIPILDTNIYETFAKTYEYQLKRIQSYFFTDVPDLNKTQILNDTDLNYLKPFYALENIDAYYYNPILIGQINNLYNSDIPSHVIADIKRSIKLDNNNMLDYKIQRIINNLTFFIETLKIIDNLNTGTSMTSDNLNYIKSFLNNNIIYTDYEINVELGTRKYNYKDPFTIIDSGTIKFFTNSYPSPVSFNIPIINKNIYESINLTSVSDELLLYYCFLYLMFDLYLLDGNMRAKYSDIDISSISFSKTDYKSIYRTLIGEYFYLILRGKQVIIESSVVTISYSKIYPLIMNTIKNIDPLHSNYDTLLQYLLYSLCETTNDINTDSMYDLFNVPKSYKIKTLQNNHYYSENFGIIYSIKNAMNDINFRHLIDLTNYNNKYTQYLYVSENLTGNVTTSQLKSEFLSKMNIVNSFTFFGNIIVTNDDYNKLSNSSLINSNVYTSVFYIDSNIGNLKINMNDIRDIKTEIIKYYYNEIKNSNIITNVFSKDDGVNKQILTINNLHYSGNLISEIDINLSNKTFSIQQYMENNSFSPSNVSSLTTWLDSKDSSNIFIDILGSQQVLNNGDKVALWRNKAASGHIINANISQQPQWNSNSGIYFNGSTYLNTSIRLNTKSTVFIVTDIPSTGGYYMYFDKSQSNPSNKISSPTIRTDGPFGNYIYNDFTSQLEEKMGHVNSGINTISFERFDGNYVNGFINGYETFNENIGNTYGTTGNVTMSILPGYLDVNNNLTESIVGNIYEILVFNDILTDDQKFSVNLYLANKWEFKTKINNEKYVKYYYFPFDYLPKLYNYNISDSSVSSINIFHNHYFDNTFSNIYDSVFYELKNISSDINYKLSSTFMDNISNISGYLYFTDVMNDLGSLVFKTVFNYDLEIDANSFIINNSNISIDPNLLTNYNLYIESINAYTQNFTIKDSFDFILNPLKYDTNYIKYSLMNHGAQLGNNSNIFHQKLPKLIEKTSVITANTNDRLYKFNNLVNLFFTTSIAGSINYDKLTLSNTYIGNTHIPIIPYDVKYDSATYDYYNYFSSNDSNILVLNSIIDINNKADDIVDEKLRIYNILLSTINQVHNDIINFNTVNTLVNQISIRPNMAVMSWIEKLGFYIADYFELYIGGELIEKVEDDIINCMFELGKVPGIVKSVAKMIGQDKRLIIKRSTLGAYTLYIDIPFFFNRYKKQNGLSIPLIALLYNKLHLKFKLKKLEDLLNFIPYTTIKKTGKMKMSVLLDYILLDFPERKKFAESKHEYLIEQLQYSTFVSSSLSSTNKIKLNFTNPTKLMVWFAQLKDKINKKQYYNYTSDDYYLDINKYIDSDQINNPYLTQLAIDYAPFINKLLARNVTANIQPFNKLNILKMPFANLSKREQKRLRYVVQPSQIPIIKNTSLMVNGHSRFKASSDETQKVRPYTYFNSSYTNGINVYNFGLHPLQSQPSGSINFSFLNDINLLVDFNPTVNQELTIKTTTISYNILRIMSGYGGLGFDIIP